MVEILNILLILGIYVLILGIPIYIILNFILSVLNLIKALLIKDAEKKKEEVNRCLKKFVISAILLVSLICLVSFLLHGLSRSIAMNM